MIKENISNFNNIIVYKDGEPHNLAGIADAFNSLLEYSYFTSSLASGDDSIMREQMKKGIWLILEYETTSSISGLKFDRLLLSIKPKYDYINLYRELDGKFSGRCIGLSLAYKTTDFYKYIVECIDNGE